MIFLTSDTHFSHEKIITHENRPFKNVEEMNESLIKNWNSKISKNDDVYHLGDVCWQTTRKEETNGLLYRLNGKIHLVRGNHDNKFILTNSRFEWIKDYYELKFNHVKHILFHYPIHSWNYQRYGIMHFHGHCHGKVLPFTKNILDVGVNCHNYFPLSLEEAVKKTEESNETYRITRPK